MIAEHGDRREREMKRVGVGVLLFTGLVAVIVACDSSDSSSSGSSGSVPPISSYDQTCTKDEDCIKVSAAHPCSCSCETSAINRNDQPRYLADRRAITCGQDIDCGACGPVRTSCSPAKRCTAEECTTPDLCVTPPPDAGVADTGPG